MLSIIQSLVSVLVPILISEAESLLGVKPSPDNHSWVVSLVNEICSLFEKHLPAWIVPNEQAVKALVEAEIEKILKV